MGLKHNNQITYLAVVDYILFELFVYSAAKNFNHNDSMIILAFEITTQVLIFCAYYVSNFRGVFYTNNKLPPIPVQVNKTLKSEPQKHAVFKMKAFSVSSFWRKRKLR